ncbi:hypothetical protein [Komarekiella delphini-convector]|nr:hypothetical protein [Komarekiella delphini-convector]
MAYSGGKITIAYFHSLGKCDRYHTLLKFRINPSNTRSPLALARFAGLFL